MESVRKKTFARTSHPSVVNKSVIWMNGRGKQISKFGCEPWKGKINKAMLIMVNGLFLKNRFILMVQTAKDFI
jgi:hypothetical protein